MGQSRRKTKNPHVKKGDMVMLTKSITASKGSPDRDQGYVGKVLRVFPDEGRVIVEGVNLRIRHTRPNQVYPQGGRVQREMSIHISNVQPVDSNGLATRIGRKRIEDPETGRGEWIRYAKSTGEELN
ncbi:MAG: 50S ribosomal protein L24 [Rhodothermaceae bacterium]|nr:50S ribosomal protein L24 [Rhodothermaceae bacterium]MYG45142.1 50S ribosomal protein L24 [Rhodothermaceae bacterium]MYK64570.1 50S ribosomal protein L24 [Rhodothermaceae bacterium]